MSVVTPQQTPYLPLVGRSGVAVATLGWGRRSPHPARSKERAPLPIKGRDGSMGYGRFNEFEVDGAAIRGFAPKANKGGHP